LRARARACVSKHHDVTFGVDTATTSCIQGYSHSNSQKARMPLYYCPLSVEFGTAEVAPTANEVAVTKPILNPHSVVH